MGSIFIFLLIATGASAAPQKNFDFSHSPCVDKAAHVTKGVAIRVFPRLTDGSTFVLDDGGPNWKVEFPELSTIDAMNYVVSGTFDGWAVYGTLEDPKHHVRGFAVQYVFGTIASKKVECLTLPAAPTRVDIDGMAPRAVSMYLNGLGRSPTGTEEQQKGRLRKLVGSGR